MFIESVQEKNPLAISESTLQNLRSLSTSVAPVTASQTSLTITIPRMTSTRLPGGESIPRSTGIDPPPSVNAVPGLSGGGSQDSSVDNATVSVPLAGSLVPLDAPLLPHAERSALPDPSTAIAVPKAPSGRTKKSSKMRPGTSNTPRLE